MRAARTTKLLLAALSFLVIAGGVHELWRGLSSVHLMQASPPRSWIVRQF
jgi:hypothetical protein